MTIDLWQVAGWVGGPVALAGLLWRIAVYATRASNALTLAEAHEKLLRGNGDDDWSFQETRRRVRAALKALDEIRETLHGEHGIYHKLAVLDSKTLQWATWRHDVIDKELNRLALEIGKVSDSLEDAQRDIAQCERRKA